MASSTDSSEGAHTLPRPELNPLLNPLLAENMGRWAEVYFTSAPEKREEAVLELLRDLEAQSSEQVASAPQAAPAVQKRVPAVRVDNAATERARTDLRKCPTCEHDNPLTHQFCGMCGSPLGRSTPEQFGNDDIEEILDPRAVDDARRSSAESDTEFRESTEEQTASSAVESARNPYDLSLFQGFRDRELVGDFEDGQSPSVRYRYYIGVILAILILSLGYMAWSGSRAQNAQGTPSPAPPPAAESAQPTANPSTQASTPTPQASTPTPPKEAEPKATVPAANRVTAASAPKSAEPPPPALNTTNAEHTPASTPVAASVPAQRALATGGLPASGGNGAEEFAMAQRYLSSSPRDSAEAARWLWKAMAKHYGPSMVALADLYLKGDGVSKNCDQARVLLDSAAQRGMAGAGERLRNLQAFGCQQIVPGTAR